MWRSAVQLCAGLPDKSQMVKLLNGHINDQIVNDQMVKCLGGLAQLARAPALPAGGQRFESVILHGSVAVGDKS